MQIPRCRFLMGSGAAAAVSALNSSPFSGVQAFGATERVPGIQLYMISADLSTDPAGAFGKLASVGYREVETAGFPGLTAAELGRGQIDYKPILDAAKKPGVSTILSSRNLPSSV